MPVPKAEGMGELRRGVRSTSVGLARSRIGSVSRVLTRVPVSRIFKNSGVRGGWGE